MSKKKKQQNKHVHVNKYADVSRSNKVALDYGQKASKETEERVTRGFDSEGFRKYFDSNRLYGNDSRREYMERGLGLII